jgi:hypothetical protein
MNEGMIASRTGIWRVNASVHETVSSEPIVETGFEATRRMIGPYLEERMGATPGSGWPDFDRIAYLRHFTDPCRWQYVLLDGRFPVGILPAWSEGEEVDGILRLRYVEPGFARLGALIERRIVGTQLVITRDGTDHEIAEQYWKSADDGEAQPWVGVRYEYWREG